jgi:hypothetical protein
MCKYSWISGQSVLSFTIGSNSDRSAFKARPLGPWNFAQIAISVPIWCKGLLPIARMVNETNTYKKQGAPDWRPALSYTFLHAQHYVQKARGSRLMSCSILYFSHAQRRIQKVGTPNWRPFLSYTFYTRSVIGSRLTYHHTFHTQQSSAYEKQG